MIYYVELDDSYPNTFTVGKLYAVVGTVVHCNAGYPNPIQFIHDEHFLTLVVDL